MSDLVSGFMFSASGLIDMTDQYQKRYGCKPEWVLVNSDFNEPPIKGIRIIPSGLIAYPNIFLAGPVKEGSNE